MGQGASVSGILTTPNRLTPDAATRKLILVVVDGGNSKFDEAEGIAERLQKKGVGFVDAGMRAFYQFVYWAKLRDRLEREQGGKAHAA